MSCHYTEKISLLIDGELNEKEIGEAAAHLNACEVCRHAQEDFLSLRREIKSYAPALDPASRHRALRGILVSENPPLWKRKVSLPAPVFAVLLFAIIALGSWLAFKRQATKPAEADAKSERVLSMPAPTQEDSRSGIDLARFDGGERASIYKVRRTTQGEVAR